MVSVFDSGLSGPGSRPGRAGHCLVCVVGFWARHFTLTATWLVCRQVNLNCTRSDNPVFEF